MTRLLEDLFDVSRTTRGMVELRKRPVDLEYRGRTRRRSGISAYRIAQAQLSKSLPGEALYVEGDPTRLEQIVTNLLNNAAKYTEPGGKIAVTLSREADQAVLRVSDTGIGISTEMQANIFDLFVQADRSLDRARGGLGIGLTLVRSLVELHGGTISVFSSGPGQGSTFTVKFPACDSATASSRRMESRDQRNREARPCRILIVDDNRDSARTLEKVLEFEGHIASCLFDGLAVSENVASFRPDVVLLDIGLPGLDGYQVAEQLRRSFPREGLTLFAVIGIRRRTRPGPGEARGVRRLPHQAARLGALKRLLAARQTEMV